LRVSELKLEDLAADVGPLRIESGSSGRANSGRACATPDAREAISRKGIKAVVASAHNSPPRSCETCQMVVAAVASETPPATRWTRLVLPWLPQDAGQNRHRCNPKDISVENLLAFGYLVICSTAGSFSCCHAHLHSSVVCSVDQG
jgi:hypothetical protein